ncbi:MAG TPA: LamB/YcsF family protein, partial [Variovorax sp.]|nr:LamB/YcsF family protein [Variovorax sp.]
ADRAYSDDGLLVPRKLPDAVIHDRGAVLARVRQLLEDGTVTSYTGKKIPMRVHSILLHGDTPGAVDLARAVRGVVEQAGRVVPISRQSD